MGGNINFGSRTEFLPGERPDDIDIKYERYGGCFVSYKKGVLYVVLSLLFTAIVSYFVYQYFSCKHGTSTINKEAENILADLLKATEKSEAMILEESSKISDDIIPQYYNLKIQPYLDEIGVKNFSFEGQVSIVFEVKDKPTSLIILNAKDLEVSETEISVTYTSKLKAEALVADSQVKENANDSTDVTDVETTNTDANSTLITETTTKDITTTEAASTVISSEETKQIIATTELPNTLLSASPNQSESSILPFTTVTSNEEEILTSTSVTEKPEIITGSDVTNIEIAEQIYNVKDETYSIKLKLPMEKGINYTLKMKFSGKIANKSGGILRSSYKQENSTKWLINTLLKPSYARTVFPCFDQPNFKTKFEIIIARRTNMSTVSNMFLKETYEVQNSPGWVWDHFEITPPMATHTVAFAVFGFNSTNSPISVPYPLSKLWARNEIKNKGTYTLKVAPKLIETYNKYFGYNYSLNKIDLVAVPNLPVGSYGSWGILFFRENELLAQDDSSFETKEHLLHILSRELAQEWFGNLISVQSWHDSWLTETISNYAHYIGMKTVEPMWDVNTQALITDIQDALDIDSMDLLPKITSLSASFEKDFDQQLMVSNKGSYVFNMLNSIMTETVFSAKIKNFVDEWKYKNFVQNNLWEALNTTQNLPSGLTIKDIAKHWLTQKGYPLITVSQLENKSLTIQQTKFSETNFEMDNTWILPLNYTTSTERIPNSMYVWLTDASPKLLANIEEKQNDSWIFFNSPAPCRINYDSDNWEALISLLKNTPESLSPANRAQLLDDAFHLAKTGLLNYSIVLDMTLYLREREQHVIPWIIAFKNLHFLNDILLKTPNYGFFEDHMIKILKPTYEKLIINDTSDYHIVKFKKIIMDWCCKLNYQPCRDWAHNEFDTWMKSNNPDTENKIPVDFRPIVYCIGVQYRGRTSWDFLRTRYQNAQNNPEEMSALIKGMSCATESWLLMKHFFNALEDEILHNSVLMWTSVSSEIAVHSAFDFLRENWSQVYSKYKHSDLAVKQILHGVLGKLTSDNDLEHVLNLFAKEKANMMSFAHDMIIIIEKLKQKIQWRQLHMPSLKTWFLNNYKI